MPWLAAAVGVGFVVLALAVYTRSLIDRPYDHFVWQASAFLEGQAAIRYPVPGNEYYQDVLPVAPIDGVPRGLIPFPPLPAIILMPFVAIAGLGTSGQIVFVGLAALDVGICWWMLGRLPVRFAVRIAATAFFAFGTVFWYTAQLNTTWYQAHVAAIGLAMLAIGFALGADRAAVETEPEQSARGGDLLATIRRDGFEVDGRQFLIGLLFGLACTARLTVLLAAPFFVLVGSGGSWWRRGWSAGLGAALPVFALFAYNLATAGDIFHPAYEFLYRAEATYYPTLGYNLDWAIEDPRYIPQNLAIMLFSAPLLLPDQWPDSLRVTTDAFCTLPGAARGLFDPECPIAVPNDVGMSVILTSPAYLLALPALGRFRSRVVAGSAIAVLLIAIVNLMHFSQGWVQFGYRFSNDFVPWAVILVALGAEAVVRRWPGAVLVGGLVVASILINAWGVAWGNLLHW